MTVRELLQTVHDLKRRTAELEREVQALRNRPAQPVVHIRSAWPRSEIRMVMSAGRLLDTSSPLLAGPQSPSWLG